MGQLPATAFMFWDVFLGRADAGLSLVSLHRSGLVLGMGLERI